MGSNSTAIPTTSVAELKYLSLLARDYPTQAAAASAVISLEATAKLPKGTEHYISDLHGEDEAFIHLLNSASGVIREKVDLVLGENVPKAIRAELATLIYYPARKLPLLKARYPERFELEAWYRQTLLRLIDVCRFVSSKHTREYVRACRRAVGISLTSFCTPTLRTTTKPSTMARSWAALSPMTARTLSSSACVS